MYTLPLGQTFIIAEPSWYPNCRIQSWWRDFMDQYPGGVTITRGNNHKIVIPSDQVSEPSWSKQEYELKTQLYRYLQTMMVQTNVLQTYQSHLRETPVNLLPVDPLQVKPGRDAATSAEDHRVYTQAMDTATRFFSNPPKTAEAKASAVLGREWS